MKMYVQVYDTCKCGRVKTVNSKICRFCTDISKLGFGKIKILTAIKASETVTGEGLRKKELSYTLAIEDNLLKTYLSQLSKTKTIANIGGKWVLDKRGNDIMTELLAPS